MTQYDAGPGDWSDRDWESPDYEQEPQARPQRLALPPWALLAIVVAAVILLCVGLVFIVRAIREGGSAAPTATPTAVATRRPLPTATMTLLAPTPTVVLPSPTVPLPTEVPTEPLDTGGIQVGGKAEVVGTAPGALNIRAEPTTQSESLQLVTDTTRMDVIDGPTQAENYTWWKVRTKKGIEGWVVSDYLKPYTQ